MQCNTKSKSFKQWARAISSTQLRHGSARHTQISIFIIVCLFSKTFCWLLLLSSLSSFLFSIFFASFQLHSDFSSSFFYCVCALDSCVYCVSIRCMDAVRCTFVSDGIRRNTGHCVCQMGDNRLWSLSIPLRLGSLRARHERNSEWTFGFWCGVIMCLHVVSIKKNRPPPMRTPSSIECTAIPTQSAIIFIWNLYACAAAEGCWTQLLLLLRIIRFWFIFCLESRTEEKKNNRVCPNGIRFPNDTKKSIASHRRRRQWQKVFISLRMRWMGTTIDKSIVFPGDGRHTTKSWSRWFNVR